LRIFTDAQVKETVYNMTFQDVAFSAIDTMPDPWLGTTVRWGCINFLGLGGWEAHTVCYAS